MSSRTGIKIPIPTYFIDSTSYSAPLMNSQKTQDGFDIVRDFRFMGRAGVRVINGLRIAYLNGSDIDSMTNLEAENDKEYLGTYLKHSDLLKILQDYRSILKNDKSARKGIDIFLSSQWPQDIADPAYLQK